MASLVKLGVDAKARSSRDLVALSEDNDSLRDQVVTLLLEIEALRENLAAQGAGFQVLRFRAGLARK